MFLVDNKNLIICLDYENLSHDNHLQVLDNLGFVRRISKQTTSEVYRDRLLGPITQRKGQLCRGYAKRFLNC